MQLVLARSFVLVMAVLAVSSLGTTCVAMATPTPTPVPPSATLPPPTTTPSPTRTPAPPTATPEPQVLRFGVPAEPIRLDPAVTLDAASNLVSAQLYETLVRFVAGTTQTEPALSTDWSVSPDGLTWDFALRQGVAFHDGTPLTAQAVVWNFQRWMDPEHPAHNGDFQYWEGMFGDPEAEPDSEGEPAGLVAAVEAVDAQTFRLVLTKPFAPLLNTLAMDAFAILSPEAVMAAGPDTYGLPAGTPPVGTGPFRLADWRAGELTLAANPAYWGPPLALSRLVFQVIADDGVRFAALRRGQIDGMLAPAADDVTRATQDSALQVVMDPRPTTAFLNLNLDDEYLGQRAVRQAIAYAIDRPALVQETFGPSWQVATQMLPPALWGYNETIEDWPYDPERARRLLAAAGVPGQLEIDLWYPDRPRPYLPAPEATARAIARYLEAVGIAVTLETEHWSAYLADRDKGAFSMWLLGWTGYNGDPDSFYFYHFSAATPREGNYDNRELQDLVLRGQVIADLELREETYRAAAVMLHDDVPRLFLAHPQAPVLLSSRVVGFVTNPATAEWFANVALQRQGDRPRAPVAGDQ